MTSTDDRLDVIETCNRFGWHADHREWDESGSLLADVIHVDYTGLSGGEPESIARADLLAFWAERFARLTATQHMITNHRVTLQGDSAVCTTDLRALHVAPTPDGAQEVVVYGYYRFGLARASAGWQIDSIVMTPTWTTGDLTLLDADGDPLTVARRFIAALAARDTDDLVACFAADGVQDMPFSPPGFPKQVAGADALRSHYDAITGSFRSMDLSVISEQRLADREWVILEFEGKLIQANGEPYNNHFFGIFHVVDGRIALYREIYDTLVFAAAVSPEKEGAAS